MQDNQPFYIILSDNGNRCRAEPYSPYVYCKENLNDTNAMWIFYDESGLPVEPKAGGNYYIKNYETSHYVNVFEEEHLLELTMQKNTQFKVVEARDGYEIQYGDSQKAWTVNDFEGILVPEPDLGLTTQMFRFSRVSRTH